MSPPRRNTTPTAALFVRIPAEQARRLDRAALVLGRAKQELVASLLERYVDPDSPAALAALGSTQPPTDVPDQHRRVTVETLDSGGLAVGHASFRARDPEVLTLEEAAELLQVPPDVVAELAQGGELPGRRVGEVWRFARRALLEWLAGPPPVSAAAPGPATVGLIAPAAPAPGHAGGLRDAPAADDRSRPTDGAQAPTAAPPTVAWLGERKPPSGAATILRQTPNRPASDPSDASR